MPKYPLPKRVPQSTTIRATRIRGGRLCEWCCRLIHDFGQAGAPYPRLARWRVSTPDGTERLCEGHKDERLGL